MDNIQITMTMSLKELMLLRYSMGIERATAERQSKTAKTPTDRLHYTRYIEECRRIETMLRDAQDAELKRLGKIK